MPRCIQALLQEFLPQRGSQADLEQKEVRPHTPVLRNQLHWLPIRQHIDCKIAVFIFNALYGRGPTYLSRFTCLSVSEVSAHMQSAVRVDLTVPRTKIRCFQPRSFSVSGPVVWNSLP